MKKIPGNRLYNVQFDQSNNTKLDKGMTNDNSNNLLKLSENRKNILLLK